MLRALMYLLILAALGALVLFGYSYTLDPATQPQNRSISVEAE